MIFDTHTHYDDHAYDADRDTLLDSLPESGVKRICNMGSTLQGAISSVNLSRQYDFVYAAVGIHPDEVYDFYPDKDLSSYDAEITKNVAHSPVMLKLKELASHKKCVAIGEIGLDYHGFAKYEKKPRKDLQKYWFLKQLELAMELDLPVSIHSRNAKADTFEILKKAHEDGLKCAVIHCYSYDPGLALSYADMGFYLGIGGTITYEGQEKLVKTLKAIPMEHILLETDCPYLTPVPVKKTGIYIRNSSLFLNYVIEKIANIKGLSERQVEESTWDNANRFYEL